MPAIPWPSTLPSQFIRGSFQEEWGEARLISQTEAGPAKMRRQSTAVPRRLTGQQYLSLDELAILREFYEDILKHGSLLFHLAYTPVDGSTPVDMDLRFHAPPSWTRVADHALVSYDLEVLP